MIVYDFVLRPTHLIHDSFIFIRWQICFMRLYIPLLANLQRNPERYCRQAQPQAINKEIVDS